MRKIPLLLGVIGLALLVAACNPSGPTIALEPEESIPTQSNDNPAMVDHCSLFDENYLG